MNLQQLYYFKTISELKNYTKASEKLLVAQSSLSHSISNLEKELGVPLFYKTGRNIEVTDYGRTFLTYVDRIIDELEAARQKMQMMLNPNQGKVRISMSHTLSNHFIPNLIKGFYEMPENRTVQFEFSQRTTRNILESFKEKTTDLGFGAKIENDALEFFPVVDEEIIAIVSPRHRLAERGSINLREIEAEPIVTYTYNCGTRYFIDRIFRQVNIEPEIALEVDEEKTMAGAVAAGIGVGLMPRISELSIFDVVPLTLENRELHRPLYMMWPRHEFCLPVVGNFRDYVIRSLSAQGADGKTEEKSVRQ